SISGSQAKSSILIFPFFKTYLKVVNWLLTPDTVTVAVPLIPAEQEGSDTTVVASGGGGLKLIYSLAGPQSFSPGFTRKRTSILSSSMPLKITLSGSKYILMP